MCSLDTYQNVIRCMKIYRSISAGVRVPESLVDETTALCIDVHCTVGECFIFNYTIIKINIPIFKLFNMSL